MCPYRGLQSSTRSLFAGKEKTRHDGRAAQYRRAPKQGASLIAIVIVVALVAAAVAVPWLMRPKAEVVEVYPAAPPEPPRPRPTIAGSANPLASVSLDPDKQGRLNLAGVQRVLTLEDELGKLRARLDRLEREMRAAVDQVHRQYRRDLVVYAEAHGELRLPRTR